MKNKNLFITVTLAIVLVVLNSSSVFAKYAAGTETDTYIEDSFVYTINGEEKTATETVILNNLHSDSVINAENVLDMRAVVSVSGNYEKDYYLSVEVSNLAENCEVKTITADFENVGLPPANSHNVALTFDSSGSRWRGEIHGNISGGYVSAITVTVRHTCAYSEETTPSTCKVKGNVSDVCTCGHSELKETLALAAHQYGEWKTTKEATSTEPGSKEKVCANCGDIITETIPIEVNEETDTPEEGRIIKTSDIQGTRLDLTEDTVLYIDQDVTLSTINGGNYALTIRGDDEHTLNVTQGSGVIQANKKLEIEGGSVKAGSISGTGGPVVINGGEISVKSIWSITDITISGGDITVGRPESYETYAVSANNSITVSGGTTNVYGTYPFHTEGDVCIKDGLINLTAISKKQGLWSCIHVGGTGKVVIDGGEIIATSSEGCAIECDNNITINGGIINANDCYRGLAASNIEINGGLIQAIVKGDISISCYIFKKMEEGILTINGGDITVGSKHYGNNCVQAKKIVSKGGSLVCNNRNIYSWSAIVEADENMYYKEEAPRMIVPRIDISECTISVPTQVVEYDGKPIVPSFSVKNGKDSLVKDTDYVISVNNNTNVGEASLTVSGINLYMGEEIISFEIVQKDIGSSSVEYANKQLYTGEEIQPAVEIDGLKEGDDYTVEYKNNIEIGKGAIKIKGINNCKGEQVVYFDIICDHSYGTWETTKEPTYTEEGSKEKVCTICGDKITESIPKLIRTGWQVIDGHRYYYNKSGVKQTGWQKIDGEWYYFKSNGQMEANAWVKDSKGWCWMDAGGRITKNKWIKSGGEWYYLKSNGYMAANEWAKDSGGWYWMNGSGRIAKNVWAKDSGGWYWMNGSGRIAKNAWAKDSKGWCWMGSNGRITKSKWIKYRNDWYYLNSSGYMVTGTQKINGKTYKFDKNGKWIS